MSTTKFISLIMGCILAIGVLANPAEASDKKVVPLKSGQLQPKPNMHRTPPAPVACIIDPEAGVSIDGVDSADILAYGIYTEDGTACIALYATDAEFIAALQNQSGTVQLRFETATACYTGFISL